MQLDDGKRHNMSERGIFRLREFYHGLTGVMEDCHKRMVETHSTIEGLMLLCQEHLTTLAELEHDNAVLLKENENMKAYQEQKRKEKNK
jgi:hypothetical protein